MKMFNIKMVTNFETIDELRSKSSLTFENVNANLANFYEILDWLDKNKAIDKDITPVFNIIKGKDMNKAYKLTWKNRYKKKANILVISNIKQMNVAMARFEKNGKWLDDIVYETLNCCMSA